MLDGSAWSTEQKDVRRYKGKCDIFLGIEHSLRKEMEEQFNREAAFAADAARITDDTAGSEDRKRTSGGVFVAVDSNLGAVVGAEEGAIDSIPGNEGRIAWVNVRRGLRVFSVYFWHSEGWAPRNEALLEGVLKQAGTTRHPCDGNVCPEDFWEEPLVSKESDACSGSERSVHVQVKRFNRRVD